MLIGVSVFGVEYFFFPLFFPVHLNIFGLVWFFFFPLGWFEIETPVVSFLP